MVIPCPNCHGTVSDGKKNGDEFGRKDVHESDKTVLFFITKI